MAKQGQHNNDQRDQDKSRGHNNPSKSMTITTGTPKKQETYAQQARDHDDPGKQAQAQENRWIDDTRDPDRVERSLRAREGDITSGRSGSDSNASRRTRG